MCGAKVCKNEKFEVLDPCNVGRKIGIRTEDSGLRVSGGSTLSHLLPKCFKIKAFENARFGLKD